MIKKNKIEQPAENHSHHMNHKNHSSDNIPRLRFPEYTGAWEKKTLIEISENGFSNGAFNDPKKVGSGYRIINVKDMYVDTTIDVNQLTRVSLDENEFLNNRVKYGDIFFTRSSLVKEGIAYSNINLSFADDLTYDGHLIKMTPKKNKYSAIFLYYNFSTSNSRKQFIKRGKTTTMTTIGQEDIASVIISFPSLPEQTKIANFLTAVDERLQALKKKKDLLEHYKKGVMQGLFSYRQNYDSSDLYDDNDLAAKKNKSVDDKKSFQSNESKKSQLRLRFTQANGKPFPNWEVKKLGEVYKVTRGNVLSMSLVVEGFDKLNKYPVYSSQTQKKGLAGYYKEYLFENAITWTTDGANAGNVNYRKGKFYCTNVCGVLLNDEGFCNQFIAEYLNTITKKYVSYVGNPKLMNNVMSEIEVPFPSLPEQTLIANFLSALDEKIQAVQQQIEKTEHWKKGLLQEMFV